MSRSSRHHKDYNIPYSASADNDDEYYFSDSKTSSNRKPHSTRQNQKSRTSSRNIFHCQKCNLPFHTFAELTAHKRSSPSAIHLTCSYCVSLNEFHNTENLDVHWRVNHSATYCSKCDLHFKTPFKKTVHIEEIHHPCTRCNLVFHSWETRRDHYLTAAVHENTFCRLCQQNFSHAAYLREHNATTHPSKPEPKSTHRTNPRAPDFFFTSSPRNDQPQPNPNHSQEPKDYHHHNHQQRQQKQKRTPPPPPPRTYPVPNNPQPPDHYATLHISHHATAAEIQKAAKMRRIETHPDRLKKQEMGKQELERIDDEAAGVGWAADILLDAEAKRGYDHDVRAWERGRSGV